MEPFVNSRHKILSYDEFVAKLERTRSCFLPAMMHGELLKVHGAHLPFCYTLSLEAIAKSFETSLPHSET